MDELSYSALLANTIGVCTGDNPAVDNSCR